MAVTMRRERATAIIEIEGKLALGSQVDDFRARWSEALAAGAKDVIVNLAATSMVDSSGIGSLIRCHSALQASGGKLKLVGANEVVRQAFKVPRLDRVFEFHPDEQSALSASAKPASHRCSPKSSVHA